MDTDIATAAPVETIPAQRGASVATDLVPPLAGCQCRDCQRARFL